MIGIFGTYRSDGLAPADLVPMTSRVLPSYSIDAPAGVGAALGRAYHASSAIGGRSSRDNGTLIAVSTGSVFDYSQFEDLGLRERTPSELVLRLVEKRTLHRLKDVNGQFAVAVYDREHHRLTLVTDRLASTAIHIWHRNGEAIFGTHTYVMLGDKRIEPKADSSTLLQLMAMQRTIGRSTPIAGVSALPAATIFEIDREGIRERQYWALEWQRPDFSEAEGAELLAKALCGAVARQCYGKSNGLMLSGGIDSRLILSAASRGNLSCWTTASYPENPELALARSTAALFGAEHHACIVAPEATLDLTDSTTVENDGLYPASTSFSAFMPEVGRSCDVALTGHGLDYTLRGYYLPTYFAEVAGSRTRLPLIKTIAKHPTGADVLRSLRQGPPLETVKRIIDPARFGPLWRGLEDELGRVLAPWLASDEPLNAWDAFILHALSKHYAFTGMMAVRAACDLAMPSFDNEVFEIYLKMPPKWRVNARMVQKALRLLSPAAADLANANTNFRADLPLWMEIPALLSRAAWRRTGLAKKSQLPSATHSAGSWQDLGALFRYDPAHKQRFSEIRTRLDALSLGVLAPDAVAACIDEHIAGCAKHTKLLRQLLTHDAWVRKFGITAHA